MRNQLPFHSLCSATYRARTLRQALQTLQRTKPSLDRTGPTRPGDVETPARRNAM